MTLGTQNNKYEFVTVKCSECGSESNPFVHKGHLNVDDTLYYISEITGFLVNKVNDKGGLLCPICNENKDVKGVING